MEKESIIPEEVVCTRHSEGDWVVLQYTPPLDESAQVFHHKIRTEEGICDKIELRTKSLGYCHIRFGRGVLKMQTHRFVMPTDIIAKFLAGEQAVKAELAKAQQKRLEQEKAEIAKKLKEKHRRRELEKIVRQELIDSGELFGDEPKRPPIPREVVDAVYKRDGGRCVYCGSVENLQLDHIIPFSKGGATTLENLQLLCQKCNLEKSNHIG